MSPLSEQILCSNCFVDEGLHLQARDIGYIDTTTCKNCGSTSGSKLDSELLEELVVEFFWGGTFFKTEFGGANLLASNHLRYGDHEVVFPKWLENDARLIENSLKIGIFHNGPPTWRLGEIEPLDRLRNWWTRRQAANEIISHFPKRYLYPHTKFYRVRKNIQFGKENEPLQFDSAPRAWRLNGRLNNRNIAALYGSESLEICMHECRVIIPDECYFATLGAKKQLKLLDLCAEVDEAGTPFESINVAMQFLFSAEEHSYRITQAIAEAASREGFDGVWYPSYFSLVKDETISNIAIFGSPIRDKRIEVQCINRAALKSASYQIRIGPIFK